MKLLVTGGAGFIGANFIHHILSTYPTYSVINLDALTYARDKSSLVKWKNDIRYRFVHGNICNSNLVDSLKQECDIIVHFAAESHVDKSIKDASAFIQTNIIGTYTLLESAKVHKKGFHHVSTDEVFGQLRDNDRPFTEITPYGPRSPYSASKALSDHLVMSYYHTYNLPATVSHCSNNYGPYHFPEKLIPLAITNLIEQKEVLIYGDGMQICDWLYVEDHCMAIDAIIHNGRIGQVYCVGGGSERRSIGVVRTILSLMNKDESSIRYVEDRLGHGRRYAVLYEKIKNELSWNPSISFEDGLAQTIVWYENNKEWWK